MNLFGSNKDKKERMPAENQLTGRNHSGETHPEAGSRREESLQAEQQYREKLEALRREQHEHNEYYGQRIAQIRQDEQYKEDLLQSQLNKLAAERAKQEGQLKERAKLMDAERIEQERLYRQKLAQIEQFERERNQAQSAKEQAFEREYQAQIKSLEDQISRLQQELESHRQQYQQRRDQLQAGGHYQEEADHIRSETNKDWNDFKLQFGDKLSHLQKDKDRLDAEFGARMIPLTDELQRAQAEIREKIGHVEKAKAVQQQMIEDRMHQLEQERQHRERQEELRRERQTLESGYLERSHQQWQGTLTRMRDIEKEYKVADRHQDIRGWTLIGYAAAKIGRIEELIVDTEAMKVRYLDVELYDDLLNGERDRHLLLPVGVATLDYSHKAVLVPTLDPQLALKIPPYRGETISRDYERTLLAALSPDYLAVTENDSNFYNRPHFDDSRFYSNRNE